MIKGSRTIKRSVCMHTLDLVSINNSFEWQARRCVSIWSLFVDHPYTHKCIQLQHVFVIQREFKKAPETMSEWKDSSPSTWLMHSDGLPVDLTYIDRAQWWHCLSEYAAQRDDTVLTLPEWQKQNNKVHCMKVTDISGMSLHEIVFKALFYFPPFTRMKPYTLYRFAPVNLVKQRNVQKGVDCYFYQEHCSNFNAENRHLCICSANITYWWKCYSTVYSHNNRLHLLVGSWHRSI